MISHKVRAFVCFAAILCIPFFPPRAGATTINIPGTANIFVAGGNMPSAPAGNGAGTAPPSYAFAAAADQYISFATVGGMPGVTGTWGCCGAGGGMNGPDGLAGATNINSTGMLSGIVDSAHSFFLAGVFLTDALPGAAPASLNFSPAPAGVGENFTSLSPALGQLFFIGDRLTGTGSGKTQQFYAPTTATRLSLGVADAQGFMGNEDSTTIMSVSSRLRSPSPRIRSQIPSPLC
jgi:hypothetical protein